MRILPPVPQESSPAARLRLYVRVVEQSRPRTSANCVPYATLFKACNGMECNGVEWSGVEWSGMKWSGVGRKPSYRSYQDNVMSSLPIRRDYR